MTCRFVGLLNEMIRWNSLSFSSHFVVVDLKSDRNLIGKLQGSEVFLFKLDKLLRMKLKVFF